MMRYAKYREWLYAITGVFSIYKIVTLWGGEEQGKAYFFLFFLAMSIGMFFFSRHFRKKFEKRKDS